MKAKPDPFEVDAANAREYANRVISENRARSDGSLGYLLETPLKDNPYEGRLAFLWEEGWLDTYLEHKR